MNSFVEASPPRASAKLLGDAVHRNSAFSLAGLHERAFTFAFRGLVYPQIWEDPRVDLEALELSPRSRIVTIASGGCNVMSYLTGDPERIVAVDLNATHIALNKLKLAALKHLPDHASFLQLFGAADTPANVEAYDRFLRGHLDDATRAYWEGTDLRGRRRITRFARGFHRFGLLGRFIGAGHLLARLYGKDPKKMLTARSAEEQHRVFRSELAPLFDKRFVRWLLGHRMSLYGLGIPPAQYVSLSDGASTAADVVRARLEKLACGFDLADNYFAWQAFNRAYAPAGHGPLPPYLQADNFAGIRDRAHRVRVELSSLTEYLAEQPAASLDRYVLLDAQDWMSTQDLTRLWHEITRTARSGARVIFRTAAQESVLPSRLPDTLLAHWRYEAERSKASAARDRSAIYGGFHLYVLAS
jgi:S-adenosylmethionine-diacylglycerol 3-amino-3-carboxypropyl transferase